MRRKQKPGKLYSDDILVRSEFLLKFRSGVHANISESILSLIEAVDRFGMNYSSNKREEDRNRVRQESSKKP